MTLMKKVETRIGQIFYAEYGDNNDHTIVLLHANPGDHLDYESIIPTLSKKYRLLCIDWPGYGKSPPPNPPNSASAMMMANVLEDFVKTLNLNKPLFIGNSVGGYAVARYALSQPDNVLGIILVSSGGFTNINIFIKIFCWLKSNEIITKIIATSFAKYYLNKRNNFVNQIIKRTKEGTKIKYRVKVDAAIWRSFLHPDHNLKDSFTDLYNVPTLLIYGQYDPVIKVKTDGKNAKICIKNAKFVTMKTGHEPFAEDPEKFINEIEPFLESCTISI